MAISGLPVQPIPGDPVEFNPRAGLGLCLSGGGYRAMLFHLGSLWRLNELGLLPRIERVSSVSGGSITAGVLGQAWSRLGFGPDGVGSQFSTAVVDPIRKLAARTIDEMAILSGVFGPGSVGDKVEAAYDRFLFNGATLQDLPDAPRFVFNSVSVQSGALWRFSKPYMADYRVGMIEKPTVKLAKAVAASSAFPPVLSPVRLDVEPEDFAVEGRGDLFTHPYNTDVVLSDGGVYDNLGLETVWKNYRTVLVSDGGGQMKPEGEPKGDWVRHAARILDIVDNQVRNLRKRQLIDSYVLTQTEPDSARARAGAYWGIRTDINDYHLPTALPCALEHTRELAELATRLRAVPPRLQERLINWGYGVSDAALRKHYQADLPQPAGFPYERGVQP